MAYQQIILILVVKKNEQLVNCVMLFCLGSRSFSEKLQTIKDAVLHLSLLSTCLLTLDEKS